MSDKSLEAVGLAIARAIHGDFDPFTNPETFDFCCDVARAAIAAIPAASVQEAHRPQLSYAFARAALASMPPITPSDQEKPVIGTRCKLCGTYAPASFSHECNWPECPHRKVSPDQEKLIAELVEVLRKLAGNAGALGAFEHEIRSVAGHTNWQCLKDSIARADDVLTRARQIGGGQ